MNDSGEEISIPKPLQFPDANEENGGHEEYEARSLQTGGVFFDEDMVNKLDE